MAFFRMSKDEMEQVIGIANISVKPCKKTVRFYGKAYPDTTGFELRNDGRLVATYCVLENETRSIYPSGEEYSHTTLYGVPLSYHGVLVAATRMALGKMQDSLS